MTDRELLERCLRSLVLLHGEKYIIAGKLIRDLRERLEKPEEQDSEPVRHS